MTTDPQARAAEVLAAHMPLGFRCECGWDSHQSATYATDHAAHVAAALAEAGLLADPAGSLLIQSYASRAEDADDERDAARAELAAEREHLADAERRGVVAALREAATGLERRAGDFKHLPGDKHTRRAHNDIARWLRARADRLTEGDDL